MLAAFGLSDRGCVRPNNEDYFITDPASGIFVLADGMGGANAGEYASRLSSESLYHFLVQAPPSEGAHLLKEAFREANRAVRQAASGNPEFDGMGTTLLVARNIGDSRLEIGSVGDSRAYLCAHGELSRVTQDQTWVEEVGSRIGLSEEALRKHPMRHMLTMAVGAADDLRIHCSTVHLDPGDQVLLCSDGLHGVLSEKILQSTLDSEKSLAEKGHYLVEAAKSEGGPDNITVVLIQVV
ncbi:MAG: serine/threonine-protein phosphatase [Acidobacteriaceae bacterium]|nr:serine/threonine-protein phosphatase [Acidobacteriaceae bacterium]